MKWTFSLLCGLATTPAAGVYMVAAWAVILAWVVLFLSLCACLLREKGRERRTLFLTLLACAVLLGSYFLASAVLRSHGLFLRRWIKAVVAVGSTALILAGIWQTNAISLKLFTKKAWAVNLCAWLAVLSLLGGGYITCMLYSWSDGVEMISGEKTVVEYNVIFNFKGYRYVNQFVHGELVDEWND